MKKTLLIIENTSINLTIDIEQINDPIISGSILNDQLLTYKNESKAIFRKIDYLYPRFQKARLENDIQKLKEIGLEMKKIELEFIHSSFSTTRWWWWVTHTADVGVLAAVAAGLFVHLRHTTQDRGNNRLAVGTDPTV